MKGDLHCVDGRLLRHDPQHDDPDLETDIGQCPYCEGKGCGDWNGDYREPFRLTDRSWVGMQDRADYAPEKE